MVSRDGGGVPSEMERLPGENSQMERLPGHLVQVRRGLALLSEDWKQDGWMDFSIIGMRAQWSN